MPWYFAVAERDHEIQNPTSAEKICLLGERLRLGADSIVLDIACGRAGPAVILGREVGRRVVGDDEGYFPLHETVSLFESAGLAVETMIASSEDDWDRYETLHWRAFEEWLAENPEDPDARDLRSRYMTSRDDYLRWQRELLGWAI